MTRLRHAAWLVALLCMLASSRHAHADARSESLEEADALSKQVETLYAESRYADALDRANRALTIRRDLLGTADAKTASALADVGAMHLALGDWVAAEPILERAANDLANLSPRLDDALASALHNLAVLHVQRGQRDKARELERRAIAILESTEHSDPSVLASSYASLAGLSTDVDAGIKLFHQALRLDEHNGSSRALALDHVRFGNFLRGHARPGAEAELEAGYALALQALGPADRITAEARRAIGRLYWGAGVAGHESGERFYRDAYDGLSNALGAKHPEVAALAQEWAVMKQIEGDLEGSLRLRREADAVEERQLSRLFESGTEKDRLDAAARLYERADRAVGLALSLGTAKRSEDAMRYALEMVLARKGQVLDAIVGGLSAMRAKATGEERRILESLAHVRAELANTALSRTPANDDASSARTASLEREEERLERAATEASAQYAAGQKRPTFETVRDALPEGSALVELFRWSSESTAALADHVNAHDQYVAFVVTKKGALPAPFVLGSAADIDALAHDFLKALASPDDRRVLDLGARLNHFLLLRLAPQLAGVTDVFVAPDSELCLVPFAALVDGHDDYLVRRFTFTYVSSGRDLLHLGAHAPSRSGARIFANPRFDGPDATTMIGRAKGRGASSADLARLRFPPLPGTEAEAAAIRSVVPSATVETGLGATEASIKAIHSPRVLHIATHGFFVGNADATASRPSRGLSIEATDEKTRARPGVDNPMLRSGLAFAGANLRQSGNEDGILTALEACSLDLRGTRLVVLSACETGVGDVRRGQGVFSMRRAFIEAGAETQVMSLWQVDDDATKTLMALYYEGLFRRGEGRSAGLRRAQLAMLAEPKTAHPYFWSAFIASGDPSPLDEREPDASGAIELRAGRRGCGCVVAADASSTPSVALIASIVATLALRRSSRPARRRQVSTRSEPRTTP